MLGLPVSFALTDPSATSTIQAMLGTGLDQWVTSGYMPDGLLEFLKTVDRWTPLWLYSKQKGSPKARTRKWTDSYFEKLSVPLTWGSLEMLMDSPPNSDVHRRIPYPWTPMRGCGKKRLFLVTPLRRRY